MIKKFTTTLVALLILFSVSSAQSRIGLLNGRDLSGWKIYGTEKWYIENFAGGFEKRANRNSVTVTLPNDQMRSTTRTLFVFRKYPKAIPGSIISLQMKPPKDKSEGQKTDFCKNQKIDWARNGPGMGQKWAMRKVECQKHKANHR